MPTVTRIDTMPYTLPLKSPLRWGAGHEMSRLEHVKVQVELSDGAVGTAEANPRPTIYGEAPESVTAIIRRYIAPALVGQGINSIADIATAVNRYALLKNNHSARAATDMALWDALAQSQGVTLFDLLRRGAPPGTPLLEQVRVSYILGTGTTEAVMHEVASVHSAGVRVLKVKTGKNFDREADLLRQIRAAYPDMDFYIDANETYSAADALPTLQAFAQLGALYCEEPLPVRLLNERAALREHSPLPLIGDDSCFTLVDVQRELAFNTFDVLNIKPARNGFTEAWAMVARVRAAGKGVMLGSQASSLLGCVHTLLFAAAAGAAHPSEGTFWLKVDDPAALPIADGVVEVADLLAAPTG